MKKYLKFLWRNIYYIVGLIIAIFGFVGIFTNNKDAMFLLLISMNCIQQDYIKILNTKYNKLSDKVLENQQFNLDTFNTIIKRLK